MKKPILILLVLVFSSLLLKAQDFTYGTFTQDEIGMTHYDKDTSAHALYLNEYGNTSITATNDDNLRLLFVYHAKIKIFDNTGIDQGNIVIPIYDPGNDSPEEVNEIKGITTYTDDNGMVKTAELDNSKIFKVRENKYWKLVKFAMPAVKKGCIIEYTYTLVSPYWQKFHSWQFQADIPKLNSEDEVHIPGFWNYNASLTGVLKLTTSSSELERECFSWYGSHADCSHYIYAMKDIPAFVEEAYMTAKKNFLSTLNFELIEETDTQTGHKEVLTKTWADVDDQLKRYDGFGGQLKKKDFFKEKIAAVISGKTDSLDKAKAIYEYIKSNIKWNNIYDLSSEGGIRKAFENHSGTTAEVNLSLVTALSAAGLRAEPVLLSTRDNGLINRLYPVMTDFDYVIAKVDIGDKSYLLDATEPLMPFGMLPLRCLNDQGRVMGIDKPSYWMDLNTSQKEINTYVLDFTLQPDGKIKGTMSHYCLGYGAYEEREKIKKFNSVDEYIESLNEKSSKFKILNYHISNLDSLDEPLSEVYEVEIKEFKDVDHDHLRFSPFILDKMNENPFKLSERSYPVDWGMPSSTRFVLTMHLPDNYTIENVPDKVAINLPNGGGDFLTEFQSDGNTFTFSHIEQLNKPVYSPAEYPYLKEMFNKIILTEKDEMVFKKKI